MRTLTRRTVTAAAALLLSLTLGASPAIALEKEIVDEKVEKS